MSIFNDLDVGGAHPFPVPTGGVSADSLLVTGSREIVTPTGMISETQDISFGVASWQGRGGEPALSFLATTYLLQQLRELFGNPAMQPVYCRWTSSGQSGAYNVASLDDGWYVFKNFRPNYGRHVAAGFVECTAAVTRVATPLPGPLGVRYSGVAMATTYVPPAGSPQPVAAFPVGSTAPAPLPFTRSGGEGAIPLSAYTNSLNVANPPNPLRYVRPATVDGLFVGGVRAYDTMGANAVPAAPGFANANWVQVYGIRHTFTGDLILTNGLVLVLVQVGTAGLLVNWWNTDAVTPGWAQVGTIQFNDIAFNTGTVNEISLERVSLDDTQVRISMTSSAGVWTRWRLRMLRGHPEVPVEEEFLNENQNGSGFSMRWSLQNAAKVAYNETAAADLGLVANAVVAPSAGQGYAATFGTTAHGPVVGFLYQNPPASAQPRGGAAATDLALGDTGVLLGNFRRYGFFAIPFTNADQLVANASGGALGTGWTSTADANASGGNAAKCASGTLSGNADLFGTSRVPQVGGYDVWFYVRVASIASGTSQITLGLWDTTSGIFMAGASTSYPPSALSTSYVWRLVSVNIIVPTAGHNMQFRALTTATLATDVFVSHAFLAPRTNSPVGSSPGAGTWPSDLWSNFMYTPTLERWHG